MRRVWSGDQEWKPDGRDWCPEMTIWPAWSSPLDSPMSSNSPLQGVHDYWSAADGRLRDSAKWMAAVLGAALAALIGTSPLAGMREHAPQTIAIVIGLSGLFLLVLTLFLVLQVMRPQSVSYTDIQKSDHDVESSGSDHDVGSSSGRSHLKWPGYAFDPLKRWKSVVETQQDLYLPCGVKCLKSLRQSMIIEDLTVAALSDALAADVPGDEADKIRKVQNARVARLRELRDAAAIVATIGEFYRVRNRSSWATYGGLTCGLLGTAAIVTAFAWPHL
jgi:hypothetical protein